MAERRGERGAYGFSNAYGGAEIGALPLAIDGVKAWYTIDSLAALADATGVSTWVDSSGNGYDLTASTVNLPTYRLNQCGGRPAVVWTGTQPLKLSASATFAPATYFIVIKKNIAAANDVILILDSSNYAYLQYSANWYISSGSFQSVPVTGGTWYLKSVTYTYINNTRWTNGTSHTPVAGAISMKHYYLGGYGAYQFNGSVSELLILNKCPSTSQRRELEDYFNTKYRIW